VLLRVFGTSTCSWYWFYLLSTCCWYFYMFPVQLEFTSTGPTLLYCLLREFYVQLSAFTCFWYFYVFLVLILRTLYVWLVLLHVPSTTRACQYLPYLVVLASTCVLRATTCTNVSSTCFLVLLYVSSTDRIKWLFFPDSIDHKQPGKNTKPLVHALRT
jgi:hypothetical protein